MATSPAAIAALPPAHFCEVCGLLNAYTFVRQAVTEHVAGRRRKRRRRGEGGWRCDGCLSPDLSSSKP